MRNKILTVFIVSIFFSAPAFAGVKDFVQNINFPLKKDEDTRAKELKYQYEVLKSDEVKKMEGKILNRTPSGYMTVDEYEALSEYKDKDSLEFDIPKIERPSDFKYIPQPLYSIVKYNDPPGGAELRLGNKLYQKRLINGQGIVSPDYSILVYPAVYYYSDSASVASDLFVIPLNEEDTNLNRILKANVAKRNPEPILSTDKTIDNFAAFRTLTPVDFSSDGTKLLVKEKIGSREDGIWQTKIYVYDFERNVSYDLREIRDSISYFWKEYMDVNLDDKRWDIIPLGFDVNEPSRIDIQAFAYTGEKPVYLGSWSVDWQGRQSRLISFKKDYIPQVSSNGYKVIKDGVESYTTVEKQEKMLKEQGKVLEKQLKVKDKQTVNAIKEEAKYNIRDLTDDYKEELRDHRKLQTLKGSTEDTQALEDAYNKYLQDQWQKDLEKTQKLIDKKQKNIDKINQKIDKLNSELQPESGSEPLQSSDNQPSETEENAVNQESTESPQ